jgi:hypothetical protein
MPENKATEQYLELYKLAVEMADRISARRATANGFFLTVNTALLAFVSTGPEKLLWLVVLGGIAFSATWWALIKSYRDLNTAKFDVILRMEEKLEARIFGDEWRKLKESPPRRWGGRYIEFNVIERVVPIVFAVLYLVVFLKAVL